MRRVPAVHLAISGNTSKSYDNTVINLNINQFLGTFHSLVFGIISDGLGHIAYSKGGPSSNGSISQVSFTFLEMMIHEYE